MPPSETSASARLQLTSAEARWRCPLRWIRQAMPPTGELPSQLWGQERVREALDVAATLRRPGAPQHLQVVTPPGAAWVRAIAQYLQTRTQSPDQIVLLDRPQASLLRGEGAPGTLHHCDGGMVVVEVARLLDEDDSWPALREAMSLGSLAQLPPDDQDSTDKPPAIDRAEISAILVGPESEFKRLRERDGGLTTLMPTRVLMRMELGRDAPGIETLSELLRKGAADAGLGEVSATALAWLIEEAAANTSRRGHVTLQVDESLQCLAEARLAQARGTLKEGSVRSAMGRIRTRRATAEDNHRIRVEFGQLLMNVHGKTRGVVNGLMVYGSGPSSYCIPGRITARVSVGREGLVNIEREAKYSGRSFDKGVFLLNGFLRGLFAQESPLGLGATLAFEQSYGKVDGDSATLAEAVALLSELAGLPCRQDIGVTGAINQRGELLPVGSINLKVLGWWKTCEQLGRTGSQGVLLPRSTVPALQIPRELQEAMDRGEFHLWAADSIEDALELLLGTSAGLPASGRRFQEGSVYARVAARLGAMSQRLYPKRREPPKRKPPEAGDGTKAAASPTKTRNKAASKKSKAHKKSPVKKKSSATRKKRSADRKHSPKESERAAATPSNERGD